MDSVIKNREIVLNVQHPQDAADRSFELVD